ncbi:transcriptional regulator [Salmonella enterica subsp. enterica serovar Oranienburg]|uniref:Transcriptional regulator n=2 Tax=Salmonella enterica TaxID=28901 RepID=A0A5V0QB51_SALER|nr:transcriptional regulator [Salmonella enterica subsp. enterica serovar Oranienburg]EAP3579826.1 transcriptional regulator [Salmonella enterica]EDC0267209.1 transcriptional regulator [Salmonella enterica subsp. enterica serovar Poona]EDV0418164.1 transcriptional regulator [Salmonella enterica subsp. enterica serovar Glostrup]EDV9252215.1 transcriptional regulator [Salmonella enterica subsp. enterica serovar Sundsvall]
MYANICWLSTDVAMEIMRVEMAVRLVEERARLGYSQVSFANQLDISREGLRLYETGQRSIGAEFLAKAAMLGVDVQYVLTGVESQNRKDVSKTLQDKALNNAPQPVITVSPQGTANVVQFAQDGSTVNIVSTQKHIVNTKAEVKPGEEHITEAQAVKLTALVAQVVELEERVKKKPASRQSVWGKLNSHCGVTRYRLIPVDKFEKAEKFLRQWIGRLNSQPMAAISDNHSWRISRYSYIKINTKGELDEWRQNYLWKHFKATSLTELSDADLDKVYRAVATKRRRK